MVSQYDVGYPNVGVVILAGGASRRMGADKGALEWDGGRAVDRLAALTRDLGLRSPIVAGRDYGLPFVLDPYPGAGPVAGLLAAADIMRDQGCDRILVLAVDAPTLLMEDLTALLAVGGAGAAYADLPLPMVIELDAIPSDIDGGAPVRRLVELAGLATVSCSDDARMRIRGANTPAERTALLVSPNDPEA